MNFTAPLPVTPAIPLSPPARESYASEFHEAVVRKWEGLPLIAIQGLETVENCHVWGIGESPVFREAAPAVTCS